MRVTEELNILGVRMTRSTQTSRVINGEELVQRVRDTTNAFKAGRFLPLTTRPWVTNIYLMSRINYRLCAFNFRQQDIQKIQSATKSWITQGYLLKPNELLLHRDPAEGGLGLVGLKMSGKPDKNFHLTGRPEITAQQQLFDHPLQKLCQSRAI